MDTDSIRDLAYAIFRNIESKNQYINIKRKMDKGEFFVQCIIELMQIRKIEYLILKNEFTITLEIENRKISFWIIEIPQITHELDYTEYFYKELVTHLYLT